MLGRPLQPNPATAPPTLSQALNRYAATPVGQPGVASASYQQSGNSRVSNLQYLLNSTKGESIEGTLSLGIGIGLDQLTSTSGFLIIKANNSLLGRAGYQDLFGKTVSLGRGRSSIFTSVRVTPIGNRSFRAIESGRIIDLAHLESKVKTQRWGVGYPNRQAFGAVDDTIFKRLLRSELGSELSTGAIVEIAFAIPELAAPWQDPYLSQSQRVGQNFVTVTGVAAQIGVGAYVGTTFGGPVGFVVGVGTGVVIGGFWDYAVKPTVSWVVVNFAGTTDPYNRIRHLQPLGLD